MKIELEKKGVKLLKQKTSISLNDRDRSYPDRYSDRRLRVVASLYFLSTIGDRLWYGGMTDRQ
jgi:hypothetical protein